MISSVSDTLHRVIYLHIGLEKTGTTSIQKAMAEKREALHRESVLFPKSLRSKNNPSHIRLLLYGLEEGLNRFLKNYPGHNIPDYPAFRAQLEKDFEREVEASGCKTIVISNEHLSSHLVSSRQIESVANILRRVANDIRIVVYLRRQDHMAVSRYFSALKGGSTHEFSFETVSEILPNYFNFDTLLSRWTRVFGHDKLIVRWFDKGCFKDGDLLTDFADAVNLPLTLDPQVLNPSFDVVRLAWLKNFNANYADLLPQERKTARKNILEILGSLGQMGPKIELSLAQSKKFLDHYTTPNCKVIAQYPPKGAAPNLSPSGDKAKFSLPEITIHDSDIINKFIWDWKVKEVDKLALTVKLQAKEFTAIREKLVLERDKARANVAIKEKTAKEFAAIREKLVLERDKARADVAIKEKTAKEFAAIREKLVLERDKARANVAMKEKTAKEFAAIREKLILERDQARADVAMKEKQIAKKAGQAKEFAAIREKLILERDKARADVAIKEKTAKEFAAIREKLILERDQARADNVAIKEKTAKEFAAIREKLILERDKARADVAMKEKTAKEFAAIREKLILERDQARADNVAIKEKTAKEFAAIREKLILERDQARADVAMKEKTAKEFAAIREKLILERDQARADVAMKEEDG